MPDNDKIQVCNTCTPNCLLHMKIKLSVDWFKSIQNTAVYLLVVY